jgi:glutathione synthase/RimK-type ligase-like ATP-grasp enzyme
VTAPGSPTIAKRLEIARELGWRVECLDPDSGWLWLLERDGVTRVMQGSYAPINHHAAAELALDKFYAAVVLERAGLRVPISQRCIAPGQLVDTHGRDLYPDLCGSEPGLRFAERHGYPVVVKPNAGARGLAVNLAHDPAGLLAAIETVWRIDRIALVQVPVPGFDLRIDVLDGELLLAYVRRPLLLIGDGRATLVELHERADPRVSDPNVAAKLHASVVWTQTLAAAGLTSDAVLAAGERLEFRTTIYNLHRCCVAEVVRELPRAWLELAVRIADIIGLRHCGVDLRVPLPEPGEDPLAQPVELATVLEVNGSPSVGQIAALDGGAEADAAERWVMMLLLDG